MGGKVALLMIDLLAGGSLGAYRNCDDAPVLPCVERLLGRARAAGALVVHVVEDFDETRFPPGSPTWNAYQIHPRVAPCAGEPVVRQHRFDAFLENDLFDILRDANIGTLVVAGLASPWCVDSAVRRAYGLGYRVVLAQDAHGCVDGRALPAAAIARHHNEILGACFADVRRVDEIAFA